MKKFLKNQKGLTLVELLAVIVILGIIAAIAVPAIANIIDNSRKDAQIANAEAMYDAARLAVVGENVNSEAHFYAEIDDDSSPGDNAPGTGYDLVDLGYMDAIPENPMGDAEFDQAFITYDSETGDYVVYLKAGETVYFDGDYTIAQIRAEGRSGLETLPFSD
ncbi:pilus assembly FimT family protein [Salisediminibacterium beveridgei]|uniref:Type IV pilus assembly protein PilA n=1 Tax=Salisediminibacterium beveridgei TaxID=632773 RepID=A0A1D7QTL1_9BACI|nr:prepilin-type N-terminal cleavage/methylation domain-containing protein [Salisediminibacterium beveridgei]AOM82354.1 hypothetical protein BBEV_0985 [Salisediminibacterium beveridgei]